jgi:hypothetical protein
MDLGDKRTMEFSTSAREITEDIARELNDEFGLVALAPLRRNSPNLRQRPPQPQRQNLEYHQKSPANRE